MATGNFRTMDNFPLYAMTELEADDSLTELDADIGKKNWGLKYHEISLVSGYYDGVQLYVKLTCDAENAGLDNPDTVSNEDCKYYLGECRSATLQQYNREIRKVCTILEKLAKDYGMVKLNVFVRFSNGEIWYSKVAM